MRIGRADRARSGPNDPTNNNNNNIIISPLRSPFLDPNSDNGGDLEVSLVAEGEANDTRDRPTNQMAGDAEKEMDLSSD